MEPTAAAAVQAAQAQIAAYLRSVQLSAFNSAEQFGDVLFEQLRVVYGTEWSKPEAVLAIQKSVENIYRYYRLKDDASVLPDVAAPVRVRFGGPDVRSLNFFNKLDHYYFSKYVNNADKGLKTYFAEEWIAKGGRSTVDLTPEQIEEIRAALGERLKNVNDVGIERIVRGATVRARNWAHFHRLREGGIELARIVAVIDSRTSEICRYLDGKLMRVGAAAAAVDRFSTMTPGDFAKEMYESPAAKGLRAANDKAEEVEKFFKGKVNSRGVLDDSLSAAGYGLPPYHVSCRTRVAGEIVSEADAPVTEPTAEAPAPPPPEFPPDLNALTVVRGLGGSTGAELVQDEHGRQWVRKRGASADHLREEFTADSAYRALGVPVPKGKLYETPQGPVKLAEFVAGQPLAALTGAARDAAETELRKHFVADALLGNWDVIGLAEDNVLVDQAGTVYRIDNGGALRFRAQGARKTAAQWGDYPRELWSMRDVHVGPEAGRIFEELELSEVAGQVAEVQRKSQALLNALPAELRLTLAARLQAAGEIVAEWRPGVFQALTQAEADLIPQSAEWRAWLQSLSASELQAVRDYSGAPAFAINRALRAGQIGTLPNPQIVAEIDAALSKARVGRDVIVFRGTSGAHNDALYQAFRDGLVKLGWGHDDGAYRSTSYLEDVARRDFGGYVNEVIFQIRVGKDSHAAYLGDARVSQTERERELLLPRGSSLRVDRIVRRGNSIVVEALLLP